jgi:hypothetical protein
MDQVRTVHSHGLHCTLHSDPLVGAKHGTAHGQPIHSSPNRLEGIHRRYRAIRVQPEFQADVIGARQRVQVAGSLRTEETVTVTIAPMKNMVDEKAHPDLGITYRLEIRRPTHLAVLDTVPRSTSVTAVRTAQRRDGGGYSRIAVGVHRDLTSLAVHLENHVVELLLRREQITVMVRAAGIRSSQGCRQSLNGPIRPEFGAGQAEA